MILGHALMNQGGYDVSVFSEKTAEQWREGPPTGTPFVAGENIDIERELGLEHWEDSMFFGDGVMLDFRTTKDTPPLTVRGRFGKLGAAVDLRTRVPRWMDDFELKGGRLIIEKVTAERVHEIAKDADLTVLATGKGELGSMVSRDPTRCEFDKPQRRLIASLVCGVEGWGLRNGHLTRPVKFTFFGDAGEWFFVPFSHKTTGPSYALNFMVRPDGYLDHFGSAKTCAEFIEIARDLISKLAPEDAQALGELRPVEDKFNYLPFAQGITPTVKNTHTLLPSNAVLVPLGDAAVTYDPIGGQGYNSAARHAKMMADAIIECGNAKFDAAWANEAFEYFWDEHGRWACEWNNLMLKGLPPATGKALQFAAEDAGFADGIFKDYFRPRGLMSWITDMDKVNEKIATTG